MKVSPWKGVFRLRKKGKLSPRFIGPFEILERIGLVAYPIALPPGLSRLHNVFHVSVLDYSRPFTCARLSTNSGIRKHVI